MTDRNASLPPWKQLSIEAANLRGKVGVHAHRLATILVSLSKDEEFLATMDETGKDAIAMLNGYTEPLCLRFAELRTMLEVFPDKSDWKDGKIATLYDRAVEILAEREKADRQPTARAVPSYKAIAVETQAALEDTKAELSHVRKQFDEVQATATSERDQLMSRIHELERENDDLRRQVKMMERLLDRQSVAA